MSEKLIYGLSHVHIAPWNASAGTYGTPKSVPGSVSLELNPLIDKVEAKRSGGVSYPIIERLKGYDGTIDFQIVPSWLYCDVFGDKLDENGAIVVTSKKRNVPTFAFLFQFMTDAQARRFVFYNCKCFRPKIAGKTNSDKIENQKDSFVLQVRPRITDNEILKWTTADIDTDIYANWFSTVY